MTSLLRTLSLLQFCHEFFQSISDVFVGYRAVDPIHSGALGDECDRRLFAIMMNNHLEILVAGKNFFCSKTTEFNQNFLQLTHQFSFKIWLLDLACRLRIFHEHHHAQCFKGSGSHLNFAGFQCGRFHHDKARGRRTRRQTWLRSVEQRVPDATFTGTKIENEKRKSEHHFLTGQSQNSWFQNRGKDLRNTR